MKISIITVVYNNRKYIADCIRSVSGQTHKDIEYIVVDGGSKDGTVDVIREHESAITNWTSERDSGIYDAMNKGVSRATGEVVGLLNADDVYYDDSVLATVADVMQDHTVDACYADLTYVDSDDLDKTVRFWRSEQYKPGYFRKGWVPAHPTFFVRRRVYQKYGLFDLDYRLAADFELMARFLERHQVKGVYIPRIFVKMRVGGATNKSVSNIVKQNVEIVRACKKNGIDMSLVSFARNKVVDRLRQFLVKPC
ncbi:glycosyltransferase [Geomonas subterranea]|uniref:Glycosyltransferase n=1 Tax=Geomonas subterranea TaxID=2847989 RepID=A0ABX8LHN5_9BACT|nr:glycosyltransferase family 2 protein [Geomonas subterranea]QXE91548.1 glycosyltransferase [Geomonas subterranea]QXM10363.1 glycosyltransferase [Geomonas subterranea]